MSKSFFLKEPEVTRYLKNRSCITTNRAKFFVINLMINILNKFIHGAAPPTEGIPSLGPISDVLIIGRHKHYEPTNRAWWLDDR